MGAARNARAIEKIRALPFPYLPRKLTPSELKKKDVYAYWSPKVGRDVWVTGALAFATSLKLEFDASVAAYIERPRYLELTERKTLEVAFWTRHLSGEEHLWLLVPTLDSDPVAGGKRRYRQEREALEAAAQAQVSLRFFLETDLIAQGPAICVWLALLPYVQTAHKLDNHSAIESRIREHFTFATATTFTEIEAALKTFNAHDVRSVVCRGIHEGWLRVDLAKSLHIHSIVRRGVANERS